MQIQVTASTTKKGFKLFPLRKELKLYPAARSRDGGKEWNLHDPFRQQFFRIGWLEFQMLSNWKEGSTSLELCKNVNAHEEEEVIEESDVRGFQRFLMDNQLLRVETSQHTETLLKVKQKGAGGLIKKLLHSYLFFRVPLIKPDRILEAILPYVAFVRSRAFLYILAFAAVLGLYLVSRQLELFFSTFPYFFSVEGMISYGLVLFMVKVLHELGHALSAKHYGLKVPTMGVAFLVMMPVLYTDTTDAWKLASRRARLEIVGAGMIAELVLAVFALLLWNFLPEGILKSATFLIATTTWLMAMFINFNPFMRFDGYYFLSDLLEVPNLQNRAFALGKWKLRNALFGLELPEPEQFPRVTRNFLIFYAYLTWIYRAALFIAIALLVYFLFFKVLGIFLMVLEVVWFLGQPVWSEMKEWHKMKNTMSWNKTTIRNLILFLAFIGLLVIPLDRSIDRDAYIKPERQFEVFSPEPGTLEEIYVKDGEEIKEGTIVASVFSPELDNKLEQAELKVNTLQWYLDRKENTAALIHQANLAKKKVGEAQKELDGLIDRKKALQIRVPFDGFVSEVNPLLKPGAAVGKKDLIASILNKSLLEVETYVREEDLKRIQVGGKGKFFTENGESGPFAVEIKGIDELNDHYLSEPWLASLYGGDIPVKFDAQNRMEIHEAVFRVRLNLLGETPELPFMMRGTVHLDAEPQSFFNKFMQSFAFVLVRESSF